MSRCLRWLAVVTAAALVAVLGATTVAAAASHREAPDINRALREIGRVERDLGCADPVPLLTVQCQRLNRARLALDPPTPVVAPPPQASAENAFSGPQAVSGTVVPDTTPERSRERSEGLSEQTTLQRWCATVVEGVAGDWPIRDGDGYIQIDDTRSLRVNSVARWTLYTTDSRGVDVQTGTTGVCQISVR